MAAYVIARLEVRDTAWRAEYGPKTAALIEKHGGRFLVRGGAMESLEGDGKLPSTIVVLEFPSMEHARAWYKDPAYAPMIKLRQSGSDAEIVLVEGL
ncbi:MAG: DUF1330 domain-containing protein [Candidatus Binatia bacterium]